MILVLGGTSDSIGICNKLNEMNLPYMVSITTEYGRDIAKKATENVFLGKLTIEDMVSLIKEKNITQIIDATHPYATIVSSNAIECSKISNTDYVRFERESLIKQIDYDDIYVVKDIEQSKKYYHDLFGLEMLLDNGGNMILSEGIVLQEEECWKDFLQGDVLPRNNHSELYFEEAEIESFVDKLERLYPETEYVNPLTTHSWGQKVIRFYDLDGNLIEVGTPA